MLKIVGKSLRYWLVALVALGALAVVNSFYTPFQSSWNAAVVADDGDDYWDGWWDGWDGGGSWDDYFDDNNE